MGRHPRWLTRLSSIMEKILRLKNTNLDIMQLIEQLRGRRFATVQEIVHTLVELEIL